MGSYGGVNFDAQDFQQTVDLAQQKALEENRTAVLAQNLIELRNDLSNQVLPDGQYYVTSDFNTKLVEFQGDLAPRPNSFPRPTVVKFFKKGELVTVVTTATNMAGGKVKAIQTDTGNFYADPNKLSKTMPNNPLTKESLDESKRINENKTIMLIIGAFILGYLLNKD
jgi:hypothetical protein